jgi:hypothetical protein
MPNNIQTIIDKFDKLVENEHMSFVDEENSYIDSETAKQFLKDSLTSMLDEIKKELPKRDEYGLQQDENYNSSSIKAFNYYRQEVINIINSHR